MRIKEIRMQQGISQRHLAAAIGVAPNTLSQYENEKRIPDPRTIECIADFLNVSLDCLFGRDEKKSAPEDGDGLNETQRKIMKCVSQMSPKEQETFLAWLQASQGRG